ncbi:phosphoribosylformylglycinamidine synthase I [Candidatus Peregrinibacteria bacterium]|jgi:phosphoribosylformylglycinamidine synthase subunit PurQ / glutaminase|nr:phosphoribosylformylglycinamidine synthase I [Candidatus Peregrinibacteria bacterium]MBT4056139.1 phosphoribosylformylglycinamidine synthase I [Candidatus Peregrinibacteria bacterium]
MATPKVLVLAGYGINSEEELFNSFITQGATGEIVHINDLIDGTKKLEDFQIIAFPGGFSYGDDTGAGNAISNKIRNNLQDEITAFAQEDKLIIGVCNGFQIIANLGLVPATKNQYGERESALMWNKTARFECRWVHTKTTSQKCIWTQGIDKLELPVAHGEGNFYTTPEILKEIKENDQIALKYTTPEGDLANGEYPHNPNGALEDIAGICDPSGRILGLMPHPERFNSPLNHPEWTRRKITEEDTGNKMFRNAVEYFTK